MPCYNLTITIYETNHCKHGNRARRPGTTAQLHKKHFARQSQLSRANRTQCRTERMCSGCSDPRFRG